MARLRARYIADGASRAGLRARTTTIDDACAIDTNLTGARAKQVGAGRRRATGACLAARSGRRRRGRRGSCIFHTTEGDDHGGREEADSFPHKVPVLERGWLPLEYHAVSKCGGHRRDQGAKYVAMPFSTARPYVPANATPQANREQLPLFGKLFDEPDVRHARRKPWAWLLRQVLAVYVTVCPKCAGRMKWREVALTRNAIREGLARAALARGPPKVKRAPLGQLSLPFPKKRNV